MTRFEHGKNARMIEEQEQLVRDYQDTFASDFGKRVLKDLMNKCKLNSTSFVRGDPYETTFYEGNRDVILYILDMMQRQMEPHEYMQAAVQPR